MENLVQLNIENFEGVDITTMTYKGKPCWIAREVGNAIGYSQGGRRFVTKITGDWSSEFIKDQDCKMLEGEELAIFKALKVDGTGAVSSKTNRSVLLLFESGLNIALAKTNKPIGVRLRRFIADKVLPQIVRDGSYIPGRKIVGDKVVGKAVDEETTKRKLAIAKEREERLRLREERLRQRENRLNKQLKRNAYKDLADELQRKLAVHDQILNFKISAAEAATGEDLSHFRPESSGNPGAKGRRKENPDQLTMFPCVKAGEQARFVGRVAASLVDINDGDLAR